MLAVNVAAAATRVRLDMYFGNCNPFVGVFADARPEPCLRCEQKFAMRVVGHYWARLNNVKSARSVSFLA